MHSTIFIHSLKGIWVAVEGPYSTYCSVLGKTRKVVLRFPFLVVQLWMGNGGSGVFLPVVIRVETEQTKLMLFFFPICFVLKP